MNKNFKLCDEINKNIISPVHQKITSEDFENIVADYINESYGNIVKFVDAGMFGDLDYIYKTDKYNPKTYMFNGEFNGFENLDGMFASTLNYISPFCIFNLSSCIKNYNNDIISLQAKNMISTILKISDIWNLCIIYAIHFHDTNDFNSFNYNAVINIKKKNKIYCEMPFTINNNNICLRNELNKIMDKNFELTNKKYTEFRNLVSCVLDAILNLSNKILSKSTEKNNQFFLDFNDELINQFHFESSTSLVTIKNLIDNFGVFIKNKLKWLIFIKKTEDF
jgi:hypothetical protein